MWLRQRRALGKHITSWRIPVDHIAPRSLACKAQEVTAWEGPLMGLTTLSASGGAGKTMRLKEEAIMHDI